MEATIEFKSLTASELEEAKSLKHGGYEKGQRIKGFSFKPMEGREDSYLQGYIRRIVKHPLFGAFLYEIVIEKNTENPEDDSEIGYIPLGLGSGDYDDRVQVLNQEFIYNFEGGGWNSEHAISKEEAISKALERWDDGVTETTLKVKVDSFKPRVGNEASYKNLLSMFW